VSPRRLTPLPLPCLAAAATQTAAATQMEPAPEADCPQPTQPSMFDQLQALLDMRRDIGAADESIRQLLAQLADQRARVLDLRGRELQQLRRYGDEMLDRLHREMDLAPPAEMMEALRQLEQELEQHVAGFWPSERTSDNDRVRVAIHQRVQQGDSLQLFSARAHVSVQARERALVSTALARAAVDHANRPMHVDDIALHMNVPAAALDRRWSLHVLEHIRSEDNNSLAPHRVQDPGLRASRCQAFREEHWTRLQPEHTFSTRELVRAGFLPLSQLPNIFDLAAEDRLAAGVPWTADSFLQPQLLVASHRLELPVEVRSAVLGPKEDVVPFTPLHLAVHARTNRDFPDNALLPVLLLQLHDAQAAPQPGSEEPGHKDPRADGSDQDNRRTRRR
jgi:hypothetical protein